jgi:L-arabonate dehydrase
MGTAAGKGDRRRLRSVDWFGEPGRMGAIYRSWVRSYPPEVFDGRPVIGIANSWSELTPCNAHLRRVAMAEKRQRGRATEAESNATDGKQNPHGAS